MTANTGNIKDRYNYACAINKPSGATGLVKNSNGSIEYNYTCILGNSYKHLGYDGFSIQYDMDLSSITPTSGSDINDLGYRNEIVLFTLDPQDISKLTIDNIVIHGRSLTLLIIDSYVYVEYDEPLMLGLTDKRVMMRLFNINNYRRRAIFTFTFLPLETGLKVNAYVSNTTDVVSSNLVGTTVIPNIGNLYFADGENFYGHTQSFGEDNRLFIKNSYIHADFYSRYNIPVNDSPRLKYFYNQSPRLLFKILEPGHYVFEFNAGIATESSDDHLGSFSSSEYKAKDISIELLHYDSVKIIAVENNNGGTISGVEPYVLQSFDYSLDYNNFGKISCSFTLNEQALLSIKVNDETDKKISLGIDNIYLYKTKCSVIVPSFKYSLGGPFLTEVNGLSEGVKPNTIEIYDMKFFDLPLFISESEYLDLLSPNDSDSVGIEGPQGETGRFGDEHYYQLETENKTMIGAVNELLDVIDDSRRKIVEALDYDEEEKEKDYALEELPEVVNKVTTRFKEELYSDGIRYNSTDKLNDLVSRSIKTPYAATSSFEYPILEDIIIRPGERHTMFIDQKLLMYDNNFIKAYETGINNFGNRDVVMSFDEVYFNHDEGVQYEDIDRSGINVEVGFIDPLSYELIDSEYAIRSQDFIEMIELDDNQEEVILIPDGVLLNYFTCILYNHDYEPVYQTMNEFNPIDYEGYVEYVIPKVIDAKYYKMACVSSDWVLGTVVDLASKFKCMKKTYSNPSNSVDSMKLNNLTLRCFDNISSYGFGNYNGVITTKDIVQSIISGMGCDNVFNPASVKFPKYTKDGYMIMQIDEPKLIDIGYLSSKSVIELKPNTLYTICANNSSGAFEVHLPNYVHEVVENNGQFITDYNGLVFIIPIGYNGVKLSITIYEGIVNPGQIKSQPVNNNGLTVSILDDGRLDLVNSGDNTIYIPKNKDYSDEDIENNPTLVHQNSISFKYNFYKHASMERKGYGYVRTVPTYLNTSNTSLTIGTNIQLLGNSNIWHNSNDNNLYVHIDFKRIIEQIDGQYHLKFKDKNIYIKNMYSNSYKLIYTTLHSSYDNIINNTTDVYNLRSDLAGVDIKLDDSSKILNLKHNDYYKFKIKSIDVDGNVDVQAYTIVARNVSYDLTSIQLYQGYIDENGEFVSDNTWVRTNYIDLSNISMISINVITPMVFVGYVAYYDENKNVVRVDDIEDYNYQSVFYIKEPNVRYIALDFETKEESLITPSDVQVGIKTVDMNDTLLSTFDNDDWQIPQSCAISSISKQSVKFIAMQAGIGLSTKIPDYFKGKTFKIGCSNISEGEVYIQDINGENNIAVINSMNKETIVNIPEEGIYVMRIYSNNNDAVITVDNLYMKLNETTKYQVQLYQGCIVGDDGGFTDSGYEYWYYNFIRTGYIDISDYSKIIMTIDNQFCYFGYFYLYDENYEFLSYLGDYDGNTEAEFEVTSINNAKYIAVDFWFIDDRPCTPNDITVTFEGKN